MRSSTYIALVSFALPLVLQGQLAAKDALYLKLAQKDSLLFHAAFNSCETAIIEDLFTADFEFYHDRGGITEGRETFVSRIAEGCANRTAGQPQPAKRLLVPGSLEVYPLFKDGELYGAIQHGIHTIEFLNNEGVYQKGDIAKFTHVWVIQDGRWKIRRELSYDHHLQQ